jgi:hypothetical protein
MRNKRSGRKNTKTMAKRSTYTKHPEPKDTVARDNGEGSSIGASALDKGKGKECRDDSPLESSDSGEGPSTSNATMEVNRKGKGCPDSPQIQTRNNNEGAPGSDAMPDTKGKGKQRQDSSRTETPGYGETQTMPTAQNILHLRLLQSWWPRYQDESLVPTADLQNTLSKLEEYSETMKDNDEWKTLRSCDWIPMLRGITSYVQDLAEAECLAMEKDFAYYRESFPPELHAILQWPVDSDKHWTRWQLGALLVNWEIDLENKDLPTALARAHGNLAKFACKFSLYNQRF